jgi:hypothetical protein
MKVSPGFRNMGCSELAILVVLGIVFFFYVFFFAGPASFFVSGLMGDNVIIQRIVMTSLIGLYFAIVYVLMTNLKNRGRQKDSD